MGKDLDILQAVKDNDVVGLQKLLQKAVKHGKTKIIGNNKKLNVNFQDADGMSALHQAALMSSAQILRTLLENGASPGLRDNKGMIALHYATWQGLAQPVQLLLHSGSPVNEQALSGETPLHLAAQHGHYDVTTQLLNYHADPTICNTDLKTPLDLACEFGRCRVVELLLRSNLCQKLLEDSPTDTLGNNRTTCLHLAARNGHVDVIKHLLQAGMNINRTTLKGTCLHEAALAGKTDAVRLLLDCGVDVNKPNSYDQTALDIVQKFAYGHAGKELKNLLKEASCAVYARALKDYSNVYDPGSLAFKEGDIITVLEQRTDGIWRGYVLHEGRMAKTGVFPANHVVLVDSKVVALKQQQQQQNKGSQMYGQIPDLLNRGPVYGSGNGNSCGGANYPYSAGNSDRGSMESSNTDDSQPATPHSFPSTPSSNYPLPPASMHASYPPRSPLNKEPSGADSGFSSSQSIPQYTPSSPAAVSQFGKPSFVFGPTVSANGSISVVHPSIEYHQHQHLHHHHLQQQHNGEWPPAPTSLPALGGAGGDMRGASPAKDSPGHSNRNSAASSDSGRGFSTGHSELKPVHSYVNVHVNNQQQQHRLSSQSYESGVSSTRQSYHSTSSSSLGSLDRLEEPGYASTINVSQLLQAGVPDNEVLHAWLHDLRYEEYYPLFLQAGYDMPTISRMTPEDLTAIGITKPAHRKRLKAEIARLNIHDGIPDFRPNDLMEWLHLLGLGIYLDTLCGQGYDSIDYVTDITWEDLEEIGIKKLGHQKKIMLAIDRLKRITSGVKRLSSVDGRTASLELLEPPPPAPPITGRWSGGEISVIPPHVFEGTALVGARPKKSPSGDSISTTGSGGSAGSETHNSVGVNTGGEMRVIPLPREDVGLSGAIPFRHNSTGSTSGNLQPDLVAIQVKKVMKPNPADGKRDANGQQLMYQSFQGSARRYSDNDVFMENSRSFESESNSIYAVATAIGVEKQKPIARVLAESQTEKHEHEINSDGNKVSSGMYGHKGGVINNVALGVDTKEHIYDMPQVSPSHKAKPVIMLKPGTSFEPATTGPLHVNTANDLSTSGQSHPSPPGGKGGKKIPPPPPKRTHSIKEESLSDSAPNSPSKAPISTTTITVAASVHQQPATTTTAKQPPPPVMQKPQKPMSPAVVNKLQPQSNQQPHPLQQQQPPPQQQPHPFSPPVAQKPQSPRPVQSQKAAVPPTAHLLPHNPGPLQVPQQPPPGFIKHNPIPSQVPQVQPPGFIKPNTVLQQSQLQLQTQPKSPLPPAKSPLTSIVTGVPQQQQQPQHMPYSQAQHRQPHAGLAPQPLGVSPQPLGTSPQSKSQAIVLPSQHLASNPSSSPRQAPQVQAFATCVKSLSEKFGKATQEDDQFPDNVSTDSDDFPPPPPPIAMDIITPKIHNYGIPSSRDRTKPEYGLQHQREYTNKPHPSPATKNMTPSAGLQSELPQKNLIWPHGHHIKAAGIVAPTKTFPEQLAGNQLRKQNPAPTLSNTPPSSDHENTPEPDPMNVISKDKRSESTTSFESNSSSSSLDSNTLPFANENVGTIKQRAANVKPSIVQTANMDDGHRSMDLNQNLFGDESRRTVAGYSNTSPSYLTQSPAKATSEIQLPKFKPQMSSYSSSPLSGVNRQPMPNDNSLNGLKATRPLAEQPSQPSEPVTVPSVNKTETGNVLSDIDDMLQGLTDELDAMLEEELAS